MKTKEELIKLGEEYFNKCGKHLFEITHPSGKKEYKHVCLLNVDGVNYRTKITFYEDLSGVNIQTSPMSSYPVEKSEYSDMYFTTWDKCSAVKQNKKLKEYLEDILHDAKEGIMEKSGI